MADACGADLVTASTWRTDTDPRCAEVQTGGEAAFAVFMAEKLPELLEIAVGAVEGVDIDRVVVMDGGQGEGVSNALNQRVRANSSYLVQTTATPQRESDPPNSAGSDAAPL
ncbi:hypothetical protein [Candidatus Palauibacter sp.]|uniref:hypothetical protein n=1 Tax=Candidatus Palauibacter sp. TaxID=3101350 RepID=UPI003B529E8E